MSQPILIKVYGNLHPADAELCAKLGDLAPLCLPYQPDPDVFSLSGDTLLISFEGIYFPLDETLAAIKNSLQANQRGKLDFLDIENWILRRYIFADKDFTEASSPLNNVLDFSGL